MDPRRERSRGALEEAVLSLARQRPLADISVAEVAALAGVSRPTFYAHAASPGALAANVLARELDELREGFAETVAETPRDEPTMQAPERALVRHVRRHAEIYRLNLDAAGDGNLRALLIDRIEVGLREHLERHPEIAPRYSVDPVDWPDEARIYAAISAAGTVAGIERWLAGREALDEEWIVQVLLRGNPEWWERTIRD